MNSITYCERTTIKLLLLEPTSRLMRKSLIYLIGFTVLLTTAGGELSAQTRAQLPQDYKETFRNNLIKGCTASKPIRASRRSHRKYCECYADGFMRRYNREELYLISTNLPSDKKEISKVVRAFMSPEIKACQGNP